MGVESGRCVLTSFTGEAPLLLIQKRPDGGVLGERLPPLLRRFDAARGEGRVGPPFVGDLIDQPRQGRRLRTERQAVAVEEDPAWPQARSTAVNDAGANPASASSVAVRPGSRRVNQLNR